MKTKARKPLALLLAVMMAFGLMAAMPLCAIADGAEDYVCEIIGTGPGGENVGYETLDAAFAALVNNTPATIKLLEDITHSKFWQVNNKIVTFDLNGKDLVFDVGISAWDCSIDYVNEGNLKLCGSTGSLLNSTCVFTYVWGDLNCSNSSNVTVNGDIDLSDHYTSYVRVSGGGMLTVNGTITAPSRDIDCPAVLCDHSEIIINGDVVAVGSEGYGVQVLNEGLVTINGTLTANDDNYIIFGASGNNYHCAPDAFQATTSKPGYHEYTYTGSEYLFAANSFVWIKAAETTCAVTLYKQSEDGNNSKAVMIGTVLAAAESGIVLWDTVVWSNAKSAIKAPASKTWYKVENGKFTSKKAVSGDLHIGVKDQNNNNQ
ncbi:MAG: hypothetical protein FWG42_02585 [Clostridiales bacterium]|nr:hypothetical protein [Clostridiales bacterium]